MPPNEAATAVANGKPATTTKLDLRSISLEQTLADFETANARVVDLTQRLLDAIDERRSLRTELELLRIEHAQTLAQLATASAAAAEAQGQLAAERTSKAYLVVRGLRALRRLGR